jgi:hypothetical protein
MRTISARGLVWALVLLLACAGAVPNFLSDAGRAHLPAWYANNHLNLGLDLRGGSYLLLGVDVDGLMQARNQLAATELAAALRSEKIGFERPGVTEQGIRIALRSAAQVEAAQTMGASRAELIEKVILPSAKPALLDTLRITMGWAWTYLVVAELVAANSGLGYAILRAQRFLQTDTIFAGIIVIGLIGLATDQLFRLAHRKAFPWLYLKG